MPHNRTLIIQMRDLWLHRTHRSVIPSSPAALTSPRHYPDHDCNDLFLSSNLPRLPNARASRMAHPNHKRRRSMTPHSGLLVHINLNWNPVEETHRQIFRRRRMNRVQWMSGGTSIERTIYQHCCSLPELDVHSHLCSNIIDLTCPHTKKLFSAEVLSDFEAQFPELPPSRLEFIEGLGVYPMTLGNLASLLEQMQRPSSVTTPTQDWLFHLCYGLSKLHSIPYNTSY